MFFTRLFSNFGVLFCNNFSLLNSHFVFYFSEIGPELLQDFLVLPTAGFPYPFFFFVVFSFDFSFHSLALLSLILMFLVLNLLNLPSFLLSFMCFFFQFYFSCLQIFMKDFSKFLFLFVTHTAPLQKQYPAEMKVLQQMLPAHVPKSCLFSEKLS